MMAYHNIKVMITSDFVINTSISRNRFPLNRVFLTLHNRSVFIKCVVIQNMPFYSVFDKITFVKFFVLILQSAYHALLARRPITTLFLQLHVIDLSLIHI